MSHLPNDAEARKAVPLYSGLLRYFPDALVEIAKLSQIGNDQHNPGEPLHWDRSKSQDELDALARHLMDAGTLDTDGARHSTKLAWRSLANLQKELEASRGGERSRGFCGALYKMDGIRCGKPAGHDAAHLGAGPNYTVSWPQECCGNPRTCADPCADGRNE